jgi:hypothetical protein
MAWKYKKKLILTCNMKGSEWEDEEGRGTRDEGRRTTEFSSPSYFVIRHSYFVTLPGAIVRKGDVYAHH